MKKVHRIKNGLYAEDVILLESESVPADCTEIPLPEGIFLPVRFVDGNWQSVLTPEEIAEKMNAEPEKSQLQILQETVDQLVLDNLMRGF